MEKLKNIILILFVLLIPNVVLADNYDVKIEEIKLIEKSEDTEIITEPSSNGLDINFGVKFKNIDDYATYEISIKNNDDRAYKLEENKDIKNSYVKYEMTSDDKTLDANASEKIYLTIKYENEIPEENYKDNKYTLSSKYSVIASYEDVTTTKKNEDKVENPKTGVFNELLLVGIIITGCGVVIYLKVKPNRKFKSLIIVVGLVMISTPIISNALTTIMININATVEIEQINTLYKTIADSAVIDNKKSKYVSLSSGIDFENVSSSSNGNGVYLRAGTENDKYPIYYYRGNLSNNNVKFANLCWKAVRTTSTGGIKLIYNGKPDGNGDCTTTTGSSTQIGMDYFNNDSEYSLSHAGYMNGIKYPMKTKTDFATSNTILYKEYINPSYYFGYDVIYDSTYDEYKFTSETQAMLVNDYSKLVGMYTFKKVVSGLGLSWYHSSASYVVAVEGDYMYTVSVRDGNKYEGPTEEMTLGTGIIDNKNGTYTIKNPVTITEMDWLKNYSKYDGYYTCAGAYLNTYFDTTCEMPYYITNVDSTKYDAYNIFLLGNSFSYSNGVYKLKDTTKVTNWKSPQYDYDKIEGRHYTCFNESGECSKLYYIYKSTAFDAYYVELENGQSIEDVIEQSETNTADSSVKQTIDKWYEKNLLDYTKYLEDTIWCNDRSFNEIGDRFINSGWLPNGENTYLYFGIWGYTHINKAPSVTCKRKKDSFTVDEKNGNGSLKYPVGLLDYNEVIMAGGAYTKYNYDFYLNNGQNWWTMTPSLINEKSVYIYEVSNNGYTGGSGAKNLSGVRPAISLKRGLEILSGDGTASNPYTFNIK